MLAAYRTRDWDGAGTALAELAAADARLGRLAGYLALYDRRVVEARAAPPGEDWDGVYDATEK
jgi:adenylate cyclase